MKVNHRSSMLIQILTAFPEAFLSPLDFSIIKRAQEAEVAKIEILGLRNFARDKHNRLDDYPFGGGPGMVMKVEPLFCATEFLLAGLVYRPKIVLMTPQGVPFTQAMADELVREKHIIIVCGHYKGVDQRFIDRFVDTEISLGDYVLSGGEIPAMVLVDAVVRLLPGAMSDPQSALTDSFRQGLLEAPVYTRPENYRGMKVPEILLSGNHAKITQWKEKQAEEVTKRKRPDLWEERGT